jgi:SMI1-KNR4 cell-wall
MALDGNRMSIIEAAYKAFCQERFPSPTETRVGEIEKRMGVRFPEDYRVFLLSFNGGYFTEPDIVPPSDDCPEDCLTVLYGIGTSDPSAEVATESSLSTFTDNDPPQVIPIGYTLMGNMLLLTNREGDRGSILLKKAWSQDCFFLADGIESFFGLLRAPTPDAE